VRFIKITLALVIGLALPTSGGLVWAAGANWWDEAKLTVLVHEHPFGRVTVNRVGCQLRARLYFDAPASAYRAPDVARNHYRFRAELKLAEGRRFVSEVFDNTEAGARVFAFTHDTASQGCWAEQEHKLRKLDVHACRGARCTPELFR
jgi:hypothetical protein